MDVLRFVVTCSFLLANFGIIPVTVTLSIEPNHDTPCVVGDAWAEECMSCTCLEGRVAKCKPIICASRLRRALDECKENEVTHEGCNICHCHNNQRICVPEANCQNTKGSTRHGRKLKRYLRKGKKSKTRLD